MPIGFSENKPERVPTGTFCSSLLLHKGINYDNDQELQDVTVHTDKVADASAHHEQMENLMRTEVLVDTVEYRKFQRIDDSANRVENAASKQPSKSRRR